MREGVSELVFLFVVFNGAGYEIVTLKSATHREVTVDDFTQLLILLLIFIQYKMNYFCVNITLFVNNY